MQLGSGCRDFIYILLKKEGVKKKREKKHASRKLENSRDVWIEGLGRDDSLGALIVSQDKFLVQSCAFGRAIHLAQTVL